MLGRKIKNFFKVIKQNEQENERDRELARLSQSYKSVDSILIEREMLKGELDLVEEIKNENDVLKQENEKLKKEKDEFKDMVSSRLTCTVCTKIMVTSLHFACFTCASRMCNECLAECAKVYNFEYDEIRICACPHERVLMPSIGKIGIGGALLPFLRTKEENDIDEKFMLCLKLFSEFYAFIAARLYFRKIINSDIQFETPFLVEKGISSIRMGDFTLSGDQLKLQVVLTSFDIDSSVSSFTFEKGNIEQQYEKISKSGKMIFGFNNEFTAEVNSVYWFYTLIKSCDAVPPHYVKGLLEKNYESLRQRKNNCIVENSYEVPFLWYDDNGRKINTRQKRFAIQRQEQLNLNN